MTALCASGILGPFVPHVIGLRLTSRIAALHALVLQAFGGSRPRPLAIWRDWPELEPWLQRAPPDPEEEWEMNADRALATWEGSDGS